jgi:hypothetical protein
MWSLDCRDRSVAEQSSEGSALERDYCSDQPVFAVVPNLGETESDQPAIPGISLSQVLRGHELCEIGPNGGYFKHL